MVRRRVAKLVEVAGKVAGGEVIYRWKKIDSARCSWLAGISRLMDTIYKSTVLSDQLR